MCLPTMHGEVLENKVVAIRNDESYYCYDWIIKFSCICDNCISNKYKSITSTKFTTKSILTEDWKLSLEIDDNAGIIFTMFYDKNGAAASIPHDANADIYKCRLRISVRNQKNLLYYTTEYENLRGLHSYAMISERGVHCLIFKSILNFSCLRKPEFSFGEVLTFVVEIYKSTNGIFKPANMTLTYAEKILKNLQQCMKFSDVTLVIGEREFPAHKGILATQSPVFQAMFEHDMKEKAENKVIIEDISGEIMQLLLDYMYTGSVDKETEEFKNLASDVLVAADKYALEGLVKICEKVIAEGLNNDNVFKVLETAIFHELDSLKKTAINFIACGIEGLLETDEFNNLLENSSTDLLKEIILAVRNVSASDSSEMNTRVIDFRQFYIPAYLRKRYPIINE